MLESFNTKNEMEYQKLSLDEQQKRGILGRLVGIIADFKNPTRNGRRYTEELWDKTFNSPIMQEKFENRCLFGELGHPVDRQEIDMEKIAICLAEKPKKGNDGKLYGVFDILNTPNGRILKTMCDYGCKIGVSSRGSGDTYEDYDGGETVEPDSYECECWDAVLLPAVKDARPRYVNESLQTSKTLKVALQEALNNSTEDERKTMVETLDSLEIDYSTEQENNPEEVDNIDEVTDESTSMAAEDSGAEVLHELQEALQVQQKQEKQIKTLQEQLSVCYTKEARYSEVLNRTKDELKEATQLNAGLKEQLDKTQAELDARNNHLESQLRRIETLRKELQGVKAKHSALNEGLLTRNNEVKILQEKIDTLQTTYAKKYKALEDQNKNLTESLEESKKDSKIIKSQASAKIAKSQELVEKYRSIAKSAIERYIKQQAIRLGVNPNEINNRLAENYSFNDIDRVCEELQQYKLTVNTLPFNVVEKKPVKMKIKESKEVIKSSIVDERLDDEVDSTLNGFI